MTLTPAETSYFSQPSAGLDPRLFRNGRLDSSIRSAILQLLFNHLNEAYTGAESWSTAWLAGSGVSYQWAANREPGDLDCLVGINYLSFRASNNTFRGLSDNEIASMLNEGFRERLHPLTELFMGTYELTFFAITAPNIVYIKPYAAYSITDDQWVVPPVPTAADLNPTWEGVVERDRSEIVNIITRFMAAQNRYEFNTNDAIKANARAEMAAAASQGRSLYNEIHNARSEAFSPSGSGYSDFANYRWQGGKRTGAIQALRKLDKKMEEQTNAANKSLYGVDFPDTNTLIRRAATYRN